jgi:small subunit ribosomal protein S24e
VASNGRCASASADALLQQVFIHPSSVNHRKRDEEATTLAEKQIMAFAEKRQNVSTGASADKAQKFIVTTTRLDPVAYSLFGAYNITVPERGLECDEWLPIVGNIDALDDIQRLKYLMEACMLRVFEGITFQRHRQRSRRDMVPLAREDEREDESDDDDDGAVLRDYSLAPAEVRDLDAMTTDIVRVLNNAADERIASQSRHNSRPGSPASSPMFGSSRLPAGNGGGNARSGTSTPFGAFSAFNSRPGVPGPGPSPLRKW